MAVDSSQQEAQVGGLQSKVSPEQKMKKKKS
jgi:hypothetical protein